MLRNDPGLILGMWVRFFSALLYAKSDNLIPDTMAGLPQRTIAQALGFEPTEGEVATGLTCMANVK